MTAHPTVLRLLGLVACGAALQGLVACGPSGPASPGPATLLEDPTATDPDVRALASKRAAAVDAQPLDPALRASLALAFEANELWVEAEAAWDNALHFNPDEPEWLGHKATALVKRGALEEGRAVYERAVELDPARDPVRLRLGLLLLELGEDQAALAHFEKIARNQPGSPSPLVAKAEALNNLEREAEAAAACEKAIQLDPSYKRAHYVLGIAYRGLGRLEEAERELALGADSEQRYLADSLSVQLNSSRRGYGARIEEAANLVGAGRAADAVPLLLKVLESHPSDRIALVNLGVAQINLGRNQEAMETLAKALALDEKDFAVLINLATAELALGKTNDALKHSDQAVKAAPNVSATYYMRSHAYMVLGRWGEAYTDLKRAASLDTGDARYPIEAGDCAAQLGRREEAIELYATGLQLQPNHLPATVSMGHMAEQLGRRGVAVDAYRKAKSLNPNHERVRALGAKLGLE